MAEDEGLKKKGLYRKRKEAAQVNMKVEEGIRVMAGA